MPDPNVPQGPPSFLMRGQPVKLDAFDTLPEADQVKLVQGMTPEEKSGFWKVWDARQAAMKPPDLAHEPNRVLSAAGLGAMGAVGGLKEGPMGVGTGFLGGALSGMINPPATPGEWAQQGALALAASPTAKLLRTLGGFRSVLGAAAAGEAGYIGGEAVKRNVDAATGNDTFGAPRLSPTGAVLSAGLPAIAQGVGNRIANAPANQLAREQQQMRASVGEWLGNGGPQDQTVNLGTSPLAKKALTAVQADQVYHQGRIKDAQNVLNDLENQEAALTLHGNMDTAEAKVAVEKAKQDIALRRLQAGAVKADAQAKINEAKSGVVQQRGLKDVAAAAKSETQLDLQNDLAGFANVEKQMKLGFNPYQPGTEPGTYAAFESKEEKAQALSKLYDQVEARLDQAWKQQKQILQTNLGANQEINAQQAQAAQAQGQAQAAQAPGQPPNPVPLQKAQLDSVKSVFAAQKADAQKIVDSVTQAVNDEPVMSSPFRELGAANTPEEFRDMLVKAPATTVDKLYQYFGDKPEMQKNIRQMMTRRFFEMASDGQSGNLVPDKMKELLDVQGPFNPEKLQAMFGGGDEGFQAARDFAKIGVSLSKIGQLQNMVNNTPSVAKAAGDFGKNLTLTMMPGALAIPKIMHLGGPVAQTASAAAAGLSVAGMGLRTGIVSLPNLIDAAVANPGISKQFANWVERGGTTTALATLPALNNWIDQNASWMGTDTSRKKKR